MYFLFFSPPSSFPTYKIEEKRGKAHVVMKTNTLRCALASFQTSLKIEILAGSRFVL